MNWYIALYVSGAVIALMAAIIFGLNYRKEPSSEEESDDSPATPASVTPAKKGSRQKINEWFEGDKGRSFFTTSVIIVVVYYVSLILFSLWVLDWGAFINRNGWVCYFWIPFFILVYNFVRSLSESSFVNKLVGTGLSFLVLISFLPEIMAVKEEYFEKKGSIYVVHNKDFDIDIEAMKDEKAKSAKTSPEVLETSPATTIPSTAPATSRPEEKYQMFWEKVSDAKTSGVPDSFEVTVLKNDLEGFEFVLKYTKLGKPYETHFKWNRAEKYGHWHQPEPALQGNWYLNPDPSGIGFSGACTEDKSGGSWIPIRLVPI